MSKKVGFAVIDRCRLHPGKEQQFRQAWERGTLLLMTKRGGLGSRLHQAEDGTWVAYAQWPNRETWEQARDLGSVDAEVSRLMSDAEAEEFSPIFLTPVADHLKHARGWSELKSITCTYTKRICQFPIRKQRGNFMLRSSD